MVPRATAMVSSFRSAALCHRDAVRSEDADRKRRIGRREGDLQRAFRRRAHGGDDDVEPVGHEIGHAVGAGDLLQLKLDAKRLGDVLGHVDIEADRLVLGIDRAERWHVDRHADADRAGRKDLLQIGRPGRHRRDCAGQEHGRDDPG